MTRGTTANEDGRLYTITELAGELGITARAIRI